MNGFKPFIILRGRVILGQDRLLVILLTNFNLFPLQIPRGRCVSIGPWGCAWGWLSEFFLYAECAALGAEIVAAEPSPMMGFLHTAFFAYAPIAVFL